MAQLFRLLSHFRADDVSNSSRAGEGLIANLKSADDHTNDQTSELSVDCLRDSGVLYERRRTKEEGAEIGRACGEHSGDSIRCGTEDHRKGNSLRRRLHRQG